MEFKHRQVSVPVLTFRCKGQRWFPQSFCVPFLSSLGIYCGVAYDEQPALVQTSEAWSFEDVICLIETQPSF